MAEHSQSNRLIEFTTAAVLDLASIDNATASTWGPMQADRYVAFLQEVIQAISCAPEVGTDATQFPGVKTYIAKIRRRRMAFGHRIVYREIDGGIRVIRILHTAMQWQDHVDVD